MSASAASAAWMRPSTIALSMTRARQSGAVSRATAEAMAVGAIRRSAADLAVAVTGIVGPGGGSTEKPVGLVHFAAVSRDGRHEHRERRFGDIGRAEVRRRAVLVALEMLEKACE